MFQWYVKHRKGVAKCYALIYLIACYLMLLPYVPEEISVSSGAEEIRLDAPVTVEAVHPSGVLETERESGAVGERKKLQCKLFGILPVATISATTVADSRVEAIGQPVGIYVKMRHVYVVGNKEISDMQGTLSNPTAYILREGDYITAVNGTPIDTKEELQEAVMASGGEPVELRVCRDGEEMQVEVSPVETKEREYKLGLWVKDDMAGVGTMTYIDRDGNFGALGHGISDSATHKLLDMEQGYLYPADITEITPSSMGSPGELTGLIAYGASMRLGTVEENCEEGVFGKVTGTADQAFEKRIYPIGYKQEIRRDTAAILFGQEAQVESYQIMIDRIDYSPKEKNKAFVFHVTDQKLIEKTGGIVQGMSGSPIIQNGKIIGAVTHVFVNDPTKGYGIFIESMLE